MFAKKISHELKSRGFDSFVTVPIGVGTETDCLQVAAFSISSNDSNINQATVMVLDYNKRRICFNNRDVMVKSLSFEDLVSVSSNVVTAKELKYHDDCQVATAKISLADLGVHHVDFTSNPIAVALMASNVAKISASSIKKLNPSNISGIALSSSADNKLRHDASWISMTLCFMSSLPVHFFCASISQFGYIRRRLTNIIHKGAAWNQPSNELSVVLHCGLAKHVSYFGMSSNRVLLMVVSGRVLEFDDAASPKRYPTRVITLYRMTAPRLQDRNTTSLKLTSFSPDPVHHRYEFADVDDRFRFEQAVLLSMELWEYDERLASTAPNHISAVESVTLASKIVPGVKNGMDVPTPTKLSNFAKHGSGAQVEATLGLVAGGAEFSRPLAPLVKRSNMSNSMFIPPKPTIPPMHLHSSNNGAHMGNRNTPTNRHLGDTRMSTLMVGICSPRPRGFFATTSSLNEHSNPQITPRRANAMTPRSFSRIFPPPPLSPAAMMSGNESTHLLLLRNTITQMSSKILQQESQIVLLKEQMVTSREATKYAEQRIACIELQMKWLQKG